MELSRQEVIQAFEDCYKGICANECPYISLDDASICNQIDLYGDVLDLLKELSHKADSLEYTLMGVMHSVDKWLDGNELEQDEVNRAATMREKLLQIIESKDAEIARLQAAAERYKLCGY